MPNVEKRYISLVFLLLFREKSYFSPNSVFLWKDKYLDNEGYIAYIDILGKRSGESDVYISIGNR